MVRTAIVTGATDFLGLNLIEPLRPEWEVVAPHRRDSAAVVRDGFSVDR